MLQGWDDHSIRIKAAKLLGCQNLSWYYGRRFSRAEAGAEFEKNQQLGAATGCWKNGMLVDDDMGTLKAHFTAQQQQQQQQQHQQQQQQQQRDDVSAAATATAMEAAEAQAGSIGAPP
jgi:transcription initiation factor TFIID subunit TAF12